jgi:hypothetical protein
VVDPGQFPDVPPDAFITLLAIGFILGAVGHLYRSRATVALGMVLIVVGVVVLPLIAVLTGAGR